MRKSLIATALMFTTICSVNAADLNKMVDGATLSIGESRDGIKVYRLGLRKDFNSKWAQTSIGYFSGYYELISYTNRDGNIVYKREQSITVKDIPEWFIAYVNLETADAHWCFRNICNLNTHYTS